MNKLLRVLFLVTFLHTPSHAFISMNEGKMLDILVAKKGMTRLSVVGDSIKNIFLFPSLVGNTDLSEIVQLNKTGHVFLLLEEEKRPFQVTILTRRGRVQDMTIIPSSRPPEPVLLKPALSAQEEEKLQMTKKQSYEDKMKAILSGIIPQELRRTRLSSSTLQTWGSLQGMPVASYEDKNAFYDVYYIDNTSSNPLMLSASLFLFGAIEAVIFENAVLAPEGKISLVLLRSKSTKKLFQQFPERT
jgi:hypothetical protein